MRNAIHSYFISGQGFNSADRNSVFSPFLFAGSFFAAPACTHVHRRFGINLPQKRPAHVKRMDQVGGIWMCCHERLSEVKQSREESDKIS